MMVVQLTSDNFPSLYRTGFLVPKDIVSDISVFTVLIKMGKVQ